MNIEEYKLIDNEFNESMFLSKVNNIAVKFYTAIMLNNMDEIKHFLSDEVIEYGYNIINKASNVGGRQMYDEINVKNSRIDSIEVNDDVYTMKVYLQLRYMDYIINLSNGNLVSGSDKHRIEVNRLFTFSKKANTKKQGIIRRCPGCGASLDVNDSGICEYCGTSYNQEDYDWILNSIDIS